MTRAPSSAARRDDWDEHWRAYAESNRHNPAQLYRGRLVFAALGLRESPGPVRLVDLGCGSGELAAQALRIRPDAEILGLDGSARAVELAGRNVPRARFHEHDLSLPLAPGASYRGWATHAVCSEVLEHLDRPAEALRNARACFAPGCRLVITVPAGPMSAFDRHIGHRRHFDRASLARELSRAGLCVGEIWGAGFPFFNLYRLTVVLRGEALVADVAAAAARDLPWSARAAMRAFSWLFRLNLAKTPLGWQLVAVASEPVAGG
jgi:SAM-dependent methyltransferase